MSNRYRMSEDFMEAIREVVQHQRTTRDYELWNEMLDAAIQNIRYIKRGGLVGQVFRSSLVMVVVDIIWKLLELYIYGEVQPRAVDTMMVLIMFPFVFKTMR